MIRQVKGNRLCILFLLLVSILFQITGEAVIAGENCTQDISQYDGQSAEKENVSEENGVTVYNTKEFTAALEAHKSPITIGSSVITIVSQAEADGRMRPIMIPSGTVIRGASENNEVCSRSPIQLEGDGVIFENMKLTFESSDALGSIPHREIFLAGHSLTLDNVGTYLEGIGGSFGGLGGSEAELLPDVYAGGYPGTNVGTNASLTVQNCRKKLEEGSIFQGIYMGHEAGIYGNVPYTGTVRLNLDVSVIVREGIYVNQNSEAEISITGSGTLRDLELYGNSHTTLSVRQSTLSNVTADRIGSVILDDSACFAPKTNTLYDVSLKNNACLDFGGVSDAFILGDLNGQENAADQPGLLVLSSDGRLDIGGTVTGKTRFWTANRTVPGTLFHKWPYITVKRGTEQENPFMLSERDTENGFRLNYIEGAWTAWNDTYKDPVEIGSIEIASAPSAVDVGTIMEKVDGSIPNEDAFFKVTWKDQNGGVISDEDVVSEDMLFYEYDYVTCIKTEYWESEDPAILQNTDWYNVVSLMPSGEHPGNYYIYSYGDAKAFTGDYTFLFCSEIFSDLNTVADVKALGNTVRAECKIRFFDSSEETPDLPLVHTHTYDGTVTEAASCSKTGKRTFTCTFAGCGDTYTAEIPKTAHTVVTDERVEPTCTQTGKTAGSHCSVCNTVILEQRTIPVTGHTEVTDPAQEATCTKEGKTQGSHCSVCNQVIIAQKSIAKTAHTEVIDPAQEATCVKEGKTQGSHCSVCNTVIRAQESIPRKAHTEVIDPGREATCAKEGKTQGSHCSVCNTVIKAQESIAKTAHTEVIDPAQEATCTKEGKTQGSHCNVCNQVIRAQESVAKTAHTEVIDPAQEATCVKEGKTQGSHCSVCSQVLHPGQIIPRKAHDYQTQVKKAFVYKDGYSKKECTRCGRIFEEYTIISPKKIELSSESYVYNGTARTPAVTVVDRNGRSIEPKYYTVTLKNHKDVGFAEVKVTFHDLYEGVLTKNFQILPEAAVLKKITPKNRSIQVKWKKQDNQTTGYVIQCSPNKKFSGKGTKSVTVGKSKASSVKIKKLKNGKKYFVRICTYKKVQSGGKSEMICSAWSKIKPVKLKK